MRFFLGVDNGGTSTKAAVYDERGQEIAVAGTSTELDVPQIGFAERDMEELWQDNCKVIRQALTDAGVRPEQIACVACCGHGKGIYLWGKDGRPACAGINSIDNRAWEYPERWRADGTEEQVFQISKQHILASQPVSLLAWMKDNAPEVIERSRYLFGCKDYVRFRLTGEAYFERSDASGCNFVNLTTREYDRRLLALMGLEDCERLLPPLKDAWELCGTVTEQAARETGLAAGTPVAGGAFDIDACAVAARVFDDKSVCMIAGTWSINEYVAAAPVLSGEVMMNSCFCSPGKYLVEECSPTSAGNLQWFIENMLPELRDDCRAEGKSVYDVVNAWVEQTQDDSCPLFLPFLMGSNVHPLAAGTFLGVNKFHDRKHLARAVYEGIVFSHRYHYEKLRRTMAAEPERVRLAGGAKNSRVWTQMFADAMKLPVEVMDVNECGTLGCAILGAAAVGAYPDTETAAKAMSRVSARITPDEGRYGYYDRRYALYKRAIALLDPLWEQMYR